MRVDRNGEKSPKKSILDNVPIDDILEEEIYAEDIDSSLDTEIVTKEDLEAELNDLYAFNDQRNIKEFNYKIDLSEIKDDNNPEKFFNIGMEYYQSGNYEKAKNIFKFLKGSILENDDVWFMSSYYLAENYLSKNKFDNALNIFKEIESKENLPLDIDERIIVRLGQIYCILNDKESAARYFIKLRNKYPDSIYLNLADCSKL